MLSLAAVPEPGSTLSLSVVLLVLGIVLGSLLTALALLTLGWSVVRSVADTRRKRVRDDLQEQLLDRLFDDEADWGDWVKRLSSTERGVVEGLLDEYIRELDGRNVERLRVLGEELEIPDRSMKRLGSRREYDRLDALTWLALLDRPDKLRAVGFRPKTTRERAAVARTRHESGDFDDTAEGLTLLLADTTAQFSVFGQDTLYQIALEEPAALFEVITDTDRSWSTPLLVQVLTVCQHVGSNVSTEDLSWLTALLEHDDETVRRAATLALGNVGWRRDIRSPALATRLINDPSFDVRRAVYRMLARWGDRAAIETLAGALQTEDNPQALVAGTNALAEQREQFPVATGEQFGRAWLWSQEQVNYDRVARTQSLSVSD
jgi:FOG: HEAT repeat